MAKPKTELEKCCPSPPYTRWDQRGDPVLLCYLKHIEGKSLCLSLQTADPGIAKRHMRLLVAWLLFEERLSPDSGAAKVYGPKGSERSRLKKVFAEVRRLKALPGAEYGSQALAIAKRWGCPVGIIHYMAGRKPELSAGTYKTRRTRARERGRSMPIGNTWEHHRQGGKCFFMNGKVLTARLYIDRRCWQWPLKGIADEDKAEALMAPVRVARERLQQAAVEALDCELATKDPSEMHIADPNNFLRAWNVALLGAVLWTAVEQKEHAEQRAKAWELCAKLAHSESILTEFDRALGTIGLVGERRVAKLVYLAVTSRFLDRPVSIAVKGPSSGGKSFSVECVLRFFPGEAFYALTAMSDRALAYSTEPLKHRHLVVYEAAGMASDFATYLIRSLLSEGRLRYETVEKTRDGLVSKFIEREGPTGLIVTTTSLRLHPENETRMLSLTVSDTQEQTAAVFRALANGRTHSADLSQWQALQTWLATSTREVVIPYAAALAELVPPLAIRLRRDFKTLLNLIRAHTILHQANRRKAVDGRLIAEIADYAAVRQLVADLVAQGADAAIKPELRETVDAVAALIDGGKAEVMQVDLRKALKLDKSAISRRVTAALEAGVLRNLEDRKGRPARLVLGDPLPDAIELLPQPERLHGCTVGGEDKDSPADLLNGVARPSLREKEGVAARRCAHCNRPGDLLECHYGDQSPWLHRDCIDAWTAAFVGDIPPFLDRSDELQRPARETAS